MRIHDVRQCSFDSWYNSFTNVTTESIILEIDDIVLNSLLSDSIILPKNHNPTVRPNRNSDSSDESWSDSGDETDSVGANERPEFPEFESKLADAIRRLGGVVFPKLNWSAPKDASWMLCGNSLKCRTFSDIYLLLKASDFIAHDLTAPFALCSDFDPEVESDLIKVSFKPMLVLRRWTDFRPDGEFRCFVRQGKLIGISQRVHDAYFPLVVQHEKDIERDIGSFFTRHVLGRFPLDNYTVDVYREPPRSGTRGHVTLIDFNVFGPPTEPLLFSWTELEQIPFEPEDSLPRFKCQRDRSIRPNAFSQYQVPIDFVEIASGSDPNKLMDFVQACVEEQSKN